MQMSMQGNLSNQRQVTIFDPIHDSIRTALSQRQVYRVVGT
jgi:hypothetical protein